MTRRISRDNAKTAWFMTAALQAAMHSARPGPIAVRTRPANTGAASRVYLLAGSPICSLNARRSATLGSLNSEAIGHIKASLNSEAAGQVKGSGPWITYNLSCGCWCIANTRRTSHVPDFLKTLASQNIALASNLAGKYAPQPYRHSSYCMCNRCYWSN